MNIFTIGHSTHDKEMFLNMLKSNDIEILVDVRSFPGSRKFPHFNKENMCNWITKNNIEYMHISELGGRRRKMNIVSPNTGWKNVSFSNYADYTLTESFDHGLNELISLAEYKRIAYMCSEHHPCRCHRSIISDNLTALGIDVFHILPYGKGTKLQKHELGGWGAKPEVVDNKVIYPSDQLIFSI